MLDERHVEERIAELYAPRQEIIEQQWADYYADMPGEPVDEPEDDDRDCPPGYEYNDEYCEEIDAYNDEPDDDEDEGEEDEDY